MWRLGTARLREVRRHLELRDGQPCGSAMSVRPTPVIKIQNIRGVRKKANSVFRGRSPLWGAVDPKFASPTSLFIRPVPTLFPAQGREVFLFASFTSCIMGVSRVGISGTLEKGQQEWQR